MAAAAASSSSGQPYLGKITHDDVTYEIFGPQNAVTQSDTFRQRMQDAFQKNVLKHGKPLGAVRMRLAHDSATAPMDVFIKKQVSFPPHLVAQIAATAGEEHGLEALWSTEDPTIRRYY